MDSFLKFVYVFIIFLAIRLPPAKETIPCKTKADCPQHIYYIIECLDGFCNYWRD
ncbi:Nodule Cysteine-Rich (NCR) secreted peptide [Medicago truncatula]|uniref:Nodule Cysteine-Rich (NCR) secreted peptide n=2 Tax=Medicago truncatula TaxID=3880 RepID=A0A072TS14_MEDTR|nr:Nodule Cysteine-Rich (NCR) secreted peptide [Medicago truncatula]